MNKKKDRKRPISPTTPAAEYSKTHKNMLTIPGSIFRTIRDIQFLSFKTLAATYFLTDHKLTSHLTLLANYNNRSSKSYKWYQMKALAKC